MEERKSGLGGIKNGESRGRVLPMSKNYISRSVVTRTNIYETTVAHKQFIFLQLEPWPVSHRSNETRPPPIFFDCSSFPFASFESSSISGKFHSKVNVLRQIEIISPLRTRGYRISDKVTRIDHVEVSLNSIPSHQCHVLHRSVAAVV